MRWSDAFGRTDEGPAVFAVALPQRGAVLGWAGEQRHVPRVSNRELYSPAIDAWAVLDGGVSSLHAASPHNGSPAGSLCAGVRVVGYRALRLIAAELGLAAPWEPFPGEVLLEVDELRTRHRVASSDCPSAVEQAQLLASCVDAPTMRWVAATLLAESRAPHG